MKRFLAAFVLLPMVSARADAPVDPAAIAARLDVEHRCVDEVRAEITRWSGLLADAKRQLERATTPAARTEAAESVGVIEGRLREAADSLLACLPPLEAPVATEEPAPPPLTPIGENVRADAPTFVGRARLEAGAVHRALVPFGGAFDVCYDALAGRHAIVRGSAALRLEVRADGAVSSRQLLRFDLGDEPFRRCVRDALTRIGSPGRPEGGAATVDVMLTLGPES